MTLFEEVVYCTRLFPHPNLCIDVPFIEMEEFRFPGHGRRRRQRKNDFQIQDQKLLRVESIQRITTTAVLQKLVPTTLPATFHSGQLAEAIGLPPGDRTTNCLLLLSHEVHLASRQGGKCHCLPV